MNMKKSLIRIICGLLLVHNVLDTDQLNKIKLKYPVVMCSEHCNLPDVSFVSIDDVYSSQIAVNYLLSIGRTRIALINSQLTNAYARYREKGFLDALGKAGMQANNNWILHITEFDFDIAVSVITSLLKQAERPDALYCVSDVYGAAAIKAIQNFGLRVPEDIAVVGFDNIDLWNNYWKQRGIFWNVFWSFGIHLRTLFVMLRCKKDNSNTTRFI